MLTLARRRQSSASEAQLSRDAIVRALNEIFNHLLAIGGFAAFIDPTMGKFNSRNSKEIKYVDKSLMCFIDIGLRPQRGCVSSPLSVPACRRLEARQAEY